MKKLIQRVILMLSMMVTSVCMPVSNSAGKTGIAELDNIIDIALHGSTNDLIAIINFTEAVCTKTQGLGGPPKCTSDEPEGTRLEVLPFLGPEGSFIRKVDIGNWAGLKISRLYAVYKNSDKVYSDRNYPSGEYAIAFVGRDGFDGVTLQIKDGKIIRIDYEIGMTPNISNKDVQNFLITPPPENTHDPY